MLLGVLEYLYHPVEALKKISNAASQLVMSYCCRVDAKSDCINRYCEPGWANSIRAANFSGGCERTSMRIFSFQIGAYIDR